MLDMLADANGLLGRETLREGQALTVPNKVTKIHNNSTTYRPYNPGEVIGDASPTIPTAPSPLGKKKKYDGLNSITVAIVLTPFDLLGVAIDRIILLQQEKV